MEHVTLGDFARFSIAATGIVLGLIAIGYIVEKTKTEVPRAAAARAPHAVHRSAAGHLIDDDDEDPDIRRVHEMEATIGRPVRVKAAAQQQPAAVIAAAAGDPADGPRDVAAATSASASVSNNSRAAQSRRNKQGEDLMNELQTLLMQAEAAMSQADFIKATRIYERALSIGKDTLNKDRELFFTPEFHLQELDIILRVGYAKVLKMLARDEEAVVLLQQVEPQLRSIGSEGEVVLAESQLVLAQSLSVLGRYAEAKAAIGTAKPIFVRMHGKTHPNLGVVAAVSALIADGEGDFDTASKYYKQAMEIFNSAENFPKLHPIAINNALHYAFMLHSKGQFSEANVLLKEFADLHQRQLPNTIDTMLFSCYFSSRLFDQENFLEAVTWARKAMDSSKRVPPVPGVDMSELVTVVQSALVDALEMCRDSSASIPAEIDNLRTMLRKQNVALPMSTSRIFCTAAASVDFVSPNEARPLVAATQPPASTSANEASASSAVAAAATTTTTTSTPNDSASASASATDATVVSTATSASTSAQVIVTDVVEEESQAAKDAAAEGKAHVTDADEPAAASTQTTSTSAMTPSTATSSSSSSSSATTVTPLSEREVFGRMSLTLELIPHPVTGVKVAPGNHLVAAFENPDGDLPLLVEHTITADDIARSAKPRLTANQSASTKSNSSIVLATPGYFSSARARTYLVTVKVYGDHSCQKQIGAHTQVLYCAVDTSVIKTFEKIDSMPKGKRIAVQRDRGFNDLHLQT